MTLPLILQPLLEGVINDDSDDWLNVSPEELDSLLQARQVGMGEATGKGDEDMDEKRVAEGLAQVSQAFSKLFENSSSHEGVEVPSHSSDGKPGGGNGSDNEKEGMDDSSEDMESDLESRDSNDEGDAEDEEEFESRVEFDASSFLATLQDLLQQTENANGAREQGAERGGIVLGSNAHDGVKEKEDMKGREAADYEKEEDGTDVEEAMVAELREAQLLDDDVEIDSNLLENLLKSYAAQEVCGIARVNE